MSDGQFNDLVDKAWAGHFGCSPNELWQPGTTLVARERLSGSGAIHLVHLRARVFAEIDPGLCSELTDLLGRIGATTNLSAEAVQQGLPAGRVLASHRGLVFHLNPQRLVVRQPHPPVGMRSLIQADQAALMALCARCEADEVDDAYVEVSHEIVYGCFEGDRLLSAGSGYRRNGFLDIGVITDPACRGRRLAPAIVAAICLESERIALIAQYRCDVGNHASGRVAEHSGFTRLFTTETIDVAPR